MSKPERSKPELKRQQFAVSSSDGWTLELKRFWVDGCLDTARRPVLMVPGYAMNDFILSYHPTGQSMVAYLAAAGSEVWTCNLRGQGGSKRAPSASRRYGMGELALDDLPAVMAQVRQRTTTQQPSIDLVGCSLGASLVYAYLAHHSQDHGVGCVIAIGGPLRWVDPHPAMRAAFISSRVAGLLPIVGTRRLARHALPLMTHVPALLSIYMNARRIDLSRPDLLVQTIDDPVPYINRQVAHWVKQGDLVVRGHSVTAGMANLSLPVLVVLANRDGIVPAATARSVADLMPPGCVDVLEVGDDERWYAHADLFVGMDAETEVFAPMAAWLARHEPSPH